MENGNFKTVLLVEDEGLTRSAMKSLILANEPLLDIDEADGLEQAKEKLSAGTYDLVFLDYHLRGNSTGLDLLNWIGEQEREVQTIMLSAQDDRDTVLECIKSGACGFISKASEQGAGVFREALKTILSGRVYLPNSVLGKGGHSPKPVSTHSGRDGRVAELAATPDGDTALFVAGPVEQGDREKNEHQREHRQGVFKRSARPVSRDATHILDRRNGAQGDRDADGRCHRSAGYNGALSGALKRHVIRRVKTARQSRPFAQHGPCASLNERPEISDAICRRKSAGLTGLLSTS